jgi:hypothetical protein
LRIRSALTPWRRQRSSNDVEVFLAGFETIENAIEKKCVVVELALEKAELEVKPSIRGARSARAPRSFR